MTSTLGQSGGGNSQPSSNVIEAGKIAFIKFPSWIAKQREGENRRCVLKAPAGPDHSLIHYPTISRPTHNLFPPIFRLPLELLSLVASFLSPSRPDTAAISLTCRYLVPVGQRAIFRRATFDLETRSQNSTSRSVSRLEFLLSTMGQHLLRYTSAILVRGHSHGSVIEQERDRLLVRLIESTPSINSLHSLFLQPASLLESIVNATSHHNIAFLSLNSVTMVGPENFAGPPLKTERLSIVLVGTRISNSESLRISGRQFANVVMRAADTLTCLCLHGRMLSLFIALESGSRILFPRLT